MVLSVQPGLPEDLQKDYGNNNPSYHIERSGVDIDKSLSTPIGRVCVDIRNCVAVVLTSADTGSQLNELRGDLEGDERAQFIEKLKLLPDYEGSQLQKAINGGKLQIIKTQPTNYVNGGLELNVGSKYALYEKGGNLLYIVGLNGEKYFNVDRVRKGLTGGLIENGIEMFFGGKQVLENGIYNIYIKGRKVELGSEEYNRIMLISCESGLFFARSIQEEYDRRQKEKDGLK